MSLPIIWQPTFTSTIDWPPSVRLKAGVQNDSLDSDVINSMSGMNQIIQETNRQLNLIGQPLIPLLTINQTRIDKAFLKNLIAKIVLCRGGTILLDQYITRSLIARLRNKLKISTVQTLPYFGYLSWHDYIANQDHDLLITSSLDGYSALQIVKNAIQKMVRRLVVPLPNQNEIQPLNIAFQLPITPGGTNEQIDVFIVNSSFVSPFAFNLKETGIFIGSNKSSEFTSNDLNIYISFDNTGAQIVNFVLLADKYLKQDNYLIFCITNDVNRYNAAVDPYSLFVQNGLYEVSGSSTPLVGFTKQPQI